MTPDERARFQETYDATRLANEFGGNIRNARTTSLARRPPSPRLPARLGR
jgi:hypothetical protein